MYSNAVFKCHPGYLIKVEKEVEENQEVIDQAVTETRNCVGLWKEGGSNDLLVNVL